MPGPAQPIEQPMTLNGGHPAAFDDLLLADGSAALDCEMRYLRGFAEAERRNQTFRAANEVMRNLTLAGAYRIQDRIVSARQATGDQIAGYKCGLMSMKSLIDKHVGEPLTGALFASGELEDGARVSLHAFRRGVIEMKVGYIFAAPITGPMANVQDLKTRVGSVAAVVELPDIAYRNADAYTAADMAAANISSAKFVRGAQHEFSDLDVDGLQVELRRGDRVITRGVGRDSLGGQWASLLTVVNLIVARGWSITAGQLVLTGKIGDKIPLDEGAYQADYGPLGRVGFQIDAGRR
jgi:2-keto-4-pentenoate hydratase